MLVTGLLFGCAASFDNQPLNQPLGSAALIDSAAPRDLVGERVIALSLSGGGMRAAAFALGVMQALREVGPQRLDVFDDLTFMSSVSGGSLTAGYIGLHGRDGLDRFRDEVLYRDLESGLRMSLFSPVNIGRLLAGGVNDRSNLAARLDREVFHGATFADLWRSPKPDVWINATDLYNRTPFPFTPPAFGALCSDLASFRVSEAVAASMAVPLVFAPVVLQTFPERCSTPLSPRIDELLADRTRVATDSNAATAQAIRNYRDPSRMRYLKLADGGLTDNLGLASIQLARVLSGTPHGPLSEADAVRIRRMLFLIVDAGRPPSGSWAMQVDGPSIVEVGVAAADAAIDSATRLSAEGFRAMTREWRDSIVRFRCGLSETQVRRHLPPDADWRCDDVEFLVGTVSAESLEPERARRLQLIPTRLVLPRADIDDLVQAGRDAAARNRALLSYVESR
jgi:NTE family protein